MNTSSNLNFNKFYTLSAEKFLFDTETLYYSPTEYGWGKETCK